ncbi:FAD dependent oxidoreductase [Lutibacter oricola]|uniref:FAD dependent oxidoreductase n=1 Tax=Lutibacter oricola TaxID=762486 RepID=A0A1H3BML2_9FLAO|nr:FAD-dependent oxidoreductase [Lutibacter oricola]SDX42584.1 FAD dependent oxidoreductase [Lutibacter oricola]
MKRRDFFKKGTKGAIAASLIPIAGNAFEMNSDLEKIKPTNWEQQGAGIKEIPNRKKTLNYDVAVLGAGLAGICAAVSAARNGVKTVLVQDRPVLGGNSSSEIRVHVNGVGHLKPDNWAERETGIIEELLLLNRFQNPQQSFPVWDHVLYDYVHQVENLDLMLNTQAIEANMDGNKIVSARCWQLTTETEFTINAQQFIDCSGDGMLAASAGAIFRTGREASSEFNEVYAPKVADGWQMGATILFSTKDMGKPMPFTPPSYTLKYDAENAYKRKVKPYVGGIWWVEVGSENDIIAEAETSRHKIMGYMYGVWDYIKNSGDFPDSENLALDWVGAVPGRRESRRFIGDYILSEKDLTEHRHFEDGVAYGGWSIDEHGEGGIENLKVPGSYFHHHFKKIYEIPYRSLYSKNIENLQFSGRNISQTHIALSSSRVMATCATMGQATGTAASLCVKKNVNPRDIAQNYINNLQEQLLRDDSYVPLRPANDNLDLARKANLIFGSSTLSGNAKNLVNGIARDIDGNINHWQADGLNAELQLEWSKSIKLSKVEIKCDTNLKKNIFMHKLSPENKKHTSVVPAELLKSMEVEARIKGEWVKVGEIDNNKTRLIKFNFDQIKTTAVRLKLKETYGYKNIKLFEVRCYEA